MHQWPQSRVWCQYSICTTTTWKGPVHIHVTLISGRIPQVRRRGGQLERGAWTTVVEAVRVP